MTRIFHWFFMWKMDPMSGFDIRLVFTLPPKDSTLQYKKCVHLWNNFPCISTLVYASFHNIYTLHAVQIYLHFLSPYCKTNIYGNMFAKCVKVFICLTSKLETLILSVGALIMIRLNPLNPVLSIFFISKTFARFY